MINYLDFGLTESTDSDSLYVYKKTMVSFSTSLSFFLFKILEEKIMKKFATILLGLSMVASVLVGCGAKEEATSDTEVKAETEAVEATTEESTTSEGYATIKEGVLMVGTEIGYPPMEYFDEDGATPIGFDMELAQALADDMGLKLEIVDTAWDGIFAGVATDKYDVILSCVSWTEGRNEEYNLSKTYVANAPVIVVPNDSDIADIADLSGKSVAVQMETTADYLIQEQVAGGLETDLRQYEKVINAFDEIKAGRVDAVCTDSVVAAYYLGDEAANYKTVWQSADKEPICMCLKKGNDSLQAALEASLDSLRASGKLGEIAVKYFGTEDVINVD